VTLGALWQTVESDYGPIVIHSNDSQIGRSILRFGYWMQDEVRSMLLMLERLVALRGNIICYDVGANIGTHTLAIATTFQARVQVRAFEAQGPVFNALCKTVEINALKNVTCHHNAVADVAGIDLDFSPPDYTVEANFGSFELMPTAKSDNSQMVHGGHERVRTVSIDFFDERVDFLKIDVEGMERLALRGARRTIAKYRPLVMVEVLKSDPEELAGFFAALSYRVVPRQENWIAIPSEMLNLQLLEKSGN
jgi:FkbM family methyltransferase